jgi:hypothetical protein
VLANFMDSPLLSVIVPSSKFLLVIVPTSKFICERTPVNEIVFTKETLANEGNLG